MQTKKTLISKLPADYPIDSIWVNALTRRVIYQYKKNNRSQLVIDEIEQGFYDEVRDPKFSPDGKNVAYAAKSDKKYFVIKNGNKLKEYDFIGYNSIRWSPDNKHLAYTAMNNKQYFVILDEKGFGPLEDEQPKEGYNVPLLIFNPKTMELAYAAKKNDSWAVEISGKRMNEYDRVMDIAFSADGKKICYKFEKDEKWGVFFDEKEYGGYDFCNSSIISTNGKKFGFVGEKNNLYYAIINGEEKEPYKRVSTLIFSPDSEKYAYHARINNKNVIVLNQAESEPFNNTFGLVFSPDSEKIAYIASHDNEKYFVSVNDRHLKFYENIEHFLLKFSPDSRHIAYLVLEDNKFFVVVDSEEFEKFDGLYTEIIFSDDSKKVMYGAVSGNAVFWVEHDL